MRENGPSYLCLYRQMGWADIKVNLPVLHSSWYLRRKFFYAYQNFSSKHVSTLKCIQRLIKHNLPTVIYRSFLDIKYSKVLKICIREYCIKGLSVTINAGVPYQLIFPPLWIFSWKNLNSQNFSPRKIYFNPEKILTN